MEGWSTAALDIEESLSGAVDTHVHMFVADVVKSSDTVDRGILDRVLGSLGLPVWFGQAYFDHAHVRLRFKLAVVLGDSWTWDGGIPQGCPLFIVALCLRVVFCRNYMLTILSVFPVIQMYFSACCWVRYWLCQFGWAGARSQQVRLDEYVWCGAWGYALLGIVSCGEIVGHSSWMFGILVVILVLHSVDGLLLVAVLPLDFHGSLPVVRSMFISGALRVVCCSLSMLFGLVVTL